MTAARDVLTLLPQAPVGHLIGLPQVARQFLFAAFDGPAVLLTTPERCAAFAQLERLGVAVSVNPALEDWSTRADKVVLDVREALELFPREVESLVLSLELGREYPRAALLEKLEALGYQPFEELTYKDRYRVQGDALEIFTSEEKGVRAEFFGDELDTLRVLEGNRPTGKLERVSLPPAEGYLPQKAWDSSKLESTVGRVFLDSPEFYSATLEAATPLLYTKLEGREVSAFGRTPLGLPDARVPLRPLPFYRARLSEFSKDVHSWLEDDYGVLLLIRHARTADYLESGILADLEPRHLKRALSVPGQLGFLQAQGEGGFELPEHKLKIVTEDLLYGFQGGSALRGKRLSGKPVADALGLQVGDYLIHPEYGIGQFLGLETLEVLGVTRDYLSLQYRGEAKIRVPIELLPTLRRHPGTTDDPPDLSGLDKQAWQKARERARANAEQLAGKLLVQYAARQVTPGYAFTPLAEWDPLIEVNFQHELTKDQISALAEVQRDLEAPHPMDRLIAGDVGFGKTEVAIRAAHRVIGHGKQVAMLVPTTLLSDQHLHTFQARFQDLPIRIEGLSRFTPPRVAEDALKGLAEGSVDLIVGTHRLLSSGIRFKNLGLIIIDEEHRFGVVQKERLKVLKSAGNLEVDREDVGKGRAEEGEAEAALAAPSVRTRGRKPKAQALEATPAPAVPSASEDALKNAVSTDVLSLSATPIPRTLYMSLVGLRDMSSIMTPPKGRKPIQTVLSPFDPIAVRDAILFELERGGKVFYIHDRVASIGSRSIYLRSLVPEARVGVVHGQMREEELEEIMLGFEGGAFDVLLSTTIVETGLDIPEANTILIERADRLGLAQLYQLRGRVGRRNQEAYAYLFHPPKITPNASRRLWAISDLNELGSGHKLAEKDMEIRGVGNILGQEQHGHVSAVSLEVYTELLAEAVAKLKGETLKAPAQVVIDLPISSRLSGEYFGGNEAERIEAYGKLSEAVTLPAISRLERDLRKKHGVPPLEVQNFIDLAKLRAIALNKRVLSIKDGLTDIEVVFAYKGLDYDVKGLKKFPFKTAVVQFPPSVRLEKKGLKVEEYARALMDLLSYFG